METPAYNGSSLNQICQRSRTIHCLAKSVYRDYCTFSSLVDKAVFVFYCNGSDYWMYNVICLIKLCVILYLHMHLFIFARISPKFCNLINCKKIILLWLFGSYACTWAKQKQTHVEGALLHLLPTIKGPPCSLIPQTHHQEQEQQQDARSNKQEESLQ